MKNTTYYLLALILLLIFSSHILQGQDDLLNIKSYSSFNHEKLPDVVTLTKEKTSYLDIIEHAKKMAAVPKSNIEVGTVLQFGSFASIEEGTNRRYLLYSPFFFDAVLASTNSKSAIMSICYHEIAHFFYDHADQTGVINILMELEADRYSGYLMCQSNSTLFDACLAVGHYSHVDQTYSHPCLQDRVKSIIDGYITAKMLVYRDSSDYKLHRENFDFFIDSVGLAAYFPKNDALFNEKDSDFIRSGRGNGSAGSKPMKRYSTFEIYKQEFYIVDNLIIRSSRDNKTVGRLIKGSTSDVIDLNGIKFIVKNTDITTRNPDNTETIIGKFYIR